MVYVGDWQIQLFLDRGINTMHKFLCTCNTVCVHITYTVVTVYMYTICEDLGYTFFGNGPVISGYQGATSLVH